MKFKTTWILLLILVGTVIYFLLVEERRQAAERKNRDQSRKLVDYGPEEVERFVFINPENLRIEMERRGRDWLIISPIVVDADESMIDFFLDTIIPGQKTGQYTDVENLEDYGLAEPFATVILFRKGNYQPDTIYVGDKTPTRMNCYIRLGNSKTVLTTREMTRNVMNKNLYHLRDKRFVHFTSDSIDAITIRDGELRIPLEKKDNHWWLTEIGARADRRKIAAYLNDLTDAYIHVFASEDTKMLDRFGLEKPKREITIWRGSEMTTVSFGYSDNGLVYVMRSGLDKVLGLEEKFLNIFDLRVSDLYAMNLSFFEIEDVRGLRYENQDTTLILKGTGGEWSIADYDTVKVKPYKVRSLLRRLTAIKFDSILVTPLQGIGSRTVPVDLILTLENQNGETIDSITITKSSESGELGTSMSANALGRLKDGSLEEIRDFIERIGISH